MAKGKKGKKSKQDEDAEWDALEAKKGVETSQPSDSKPKVEYLELCCYCGLF